MKLDVISSGLVCLVLGAMTACGGAASLPPAASPAAEAQAPTAAADGPQVGASCGESSRPDVQQWQSAVLTAIGRDTQYELFDYVFENDKVYVGLRTASLGLTDAQLEAVRQVDAQYAHGPVEAREHGDLLLARAWAPSSGGLARAE